MTGRYRCRPQCLFLLLCLIGAGVAATMVDYILRSHRRPPGQLSPSDKVLQVHEDSSPVVVFVASESACEFRADFSTPRGFVSQICIYDPKVDRVISNFIDKNHFWEKELVRPMLDMMDRESTRKVPDGRAAGGGRERDSPGGRLADVSLVDLGCNIGAFTLSAALSGYSVLAVDAMKSSLQLLGTSLRLAGVESRVTMLHNAISDRHQVLCVRLQPRNTGGSAVFPTERGATNACDEVKSVCLDDLVPHVRTRRVFVKMDIEASEWLALRCADKFFSQLDVPYVLMEWMHYKQDHVPQGELLIREMTRLGYEPYSAYGVGAFLMNRYKAHWPKDVLWKKR